MQGIKFELKEIFKQEGIGYLERYIENDVRGIVGLGWKDYVMLKEDLDCSEEQWGRHIAKKLVEEWKAEETENSDSPILSMIKQNFNESAVLVDNVIKLHLKTISDAQFILLANIYKQAGMMSVVAKRSGGGITVIFKLDK